MTLRAKTLLLWIMLVVVLVAIIYAGTTIIMSRGTIQTERGAAMANAQLARRLIKQEQLDLSRLAAEFARWDDAYQYMREPNAAFIASNFSTSTFASLDVDFIVLLRHDRGVAWGTAYDKSTEQFKPLPGDLRDFYTPQCLLTERGDTGSGRHGIVVLQSGPYVVSARPILTSNSHGPSLGTLVFGRKLDTVALTRLGHQISMRLRVIAYPPSDETLDQSALDTLLADQTLVTPGETDVVVSQVLLRDLQKNPALILEVSQDRQLVNQGQESHLHLLLTLVGVAAVTIVVGVLLLERALLSRLTRLSQAVIEIGKHGDLTKRLSIAGTDELSELAGVINVTLDSLQQAQYQHSETLARFQAIVEQAFDAIILVDATTRRVVDANNAAADLLGYSRAAMMGMTIDALMATDDLLPLPDITNAPSEHMRFAAEVTVKRQDGNAIEMEVHTNLIRIEEMLAWCVVGRDITERKRTEAALRENRYFTERILGTSPNILYIQDIINNANIYTNQGIETLLGYSVEEMAKLGPTFLSQIMHPEDIPRLLEHMREVAACRDDQILDFDYRMRDAKGQWRWMSSRDTVFARLPDGRVSQIIGTAQDVTERMTAERGERLALRILQRLGHHDPDRGAVGDILDDIQEFTGFDAIAIRLFDGHDYPYVETRGLSDEFLARERSIVCHDTNGQPIVDGQGNLCLECMCGCVIRGAIDTTLPVYTAGGSFWTNSTTRMLATFTPPATMLNPRDTCPAHGFESVALIPLRAGSQIIGLLQLNDARPDQLSAEMIAFFEGIGISIGIAITRRRAEETIRENEVKYHTLFDTSASGIFLLALDGVIVDVNPAACQMFGFTREELLARSVLDLLPERLHERAIEELGTQPDVGTAQYEFNCIRRDRSVFPAGAQSQAITLGTQRVVMVYLEDITARKEAEAAAVRRERLERAFQERLKALHEVRDVLLTMRNTDELCLRAVMFAHSHLKFERMSIWLLNADKTVVHGTYGSAADGSLQDERHSRVPILPETDQEYLVRNKPHTWLIEDTPLYDQSDVVGHGARLIATIWDGDDIIGWMAMDNYTTGEPITAHDCELMELYAVTFGHIYLRMIADAAMSAEKEMLAVTLRSIGDGVITTDRQGRVLLMNRIAETLTGWSQEDGRGQWLPDLFHIVDEHTRERRENPVDVVLRAGGIMSLDDHGVVVARDGTERMIASRGAPIYDRDSQIIGVVLVFRDITDQRRIEIELQKADKLESIGLLAGGIAHDFNNLLAAILGNISLARMHQHIDPPVAQRLAEAEKASLRARDLTRQLLTFSKGGTPVKKITDVGEIIRDTTAFALTGSAVQCEVTISDDLWPADVDAGQISQVLHNLVINAEQAMPNGGLIKVHADNRLIDADFVPALPAGPYLQIVVADNGTGISEEHLAKLFDPYFTTKPTGNGLGLTTAYAIIVNHRGVIEVASTVGVGTTFTIYLPATPGSAVVGEQTDDTGAADTGRILVLDDEELVREIVTEMLNVLGFEVTTVGTGEEAVRVYREAFDQGTPYDVLITDLTIPGGIGGKDVVNNILEFDPAVRAIVSSGYSMDPIMANYAAYGFHGVLAKPYQVAELRTVIRKVLRHSLNID